MVNEKNEKKDSTIKKDSTDSEEEDIREIRGTTMLLSAPDVSEFEKAENNDSAEEIAPTRGFSGTLKYKKKRK